MITDKGLVFERIHPAGFGMQRFYKLANGYGLSAVNGAMLHFYDFSWEFAVLKMEGEGEFNYDGDWSINHDTPLTDDVVVTFSDRQADEFIERATKWAEAPFFVEKSKDNEMEDEGEE